MELLKTEKFRLSALVRISTSVKTPDKSITVSSASSVTVTAVLKLWLSVTSTPWACVVRSSMCSNFVSVQFLMIVAMSQSLAKVYDIRPSRRGWRSSRRDVCAPSWLEPVAAATAAVEARN